MYVHMVTEYLSYKKVCPCTFVFDGEQNIFELFLHTRIPIALLSSKFFHYKTLIKLRVMPNIAFKLLYHTVAQEAIKMTSIVPKMIFLLYHICNLYFRYCDMFYRFVQMLLHFFVLYANISTKECFSE